MRVIVVASMARPDRLSPWVGSSRRLGVGTAVLVVCCVLASHAQTPRRPYSVIAYGGNYLHNYLIPPAPSATPFAPTWSPDGRRIVFSLHGSIWIMAASGGTAREVVSGPKYYSSPTWSPDGRSIVYTADDGGKTIELEVLNVATGMTTALTRDASAYLDPIFSPDGTRLAYVTAKPNGFLNVFVREIRDGAWNGEPMPITEDSTTPVALERPYFTPQDMHTAPSWIDDRELLIVSNRGVPLGSGSILRVPVEPLGIQRALVVVDEQTLYHARPVVSPDRRRIAYVSADGGRQARHDLIVRALDGRSVSPPLDDRRRLTHGAFDVFRPRWSPDGRRLLCLSNERGLPELAIVDADSGAVQRIPATTLTYRDPRAHLAVTVRDAASGAILPARVHVVAADGRSYAPTGEYSRISWAGDRVFHTTGTFALDLPAGRTQVRVAHGFEFTPVQMDIDAGAGERRRIDIRLPRLDDPSSRGRYGGSTGAHMQASGLMLERLDALVRMAEAEGVAMISNPLADRPHDLTERDLWTTGGPPHRASSRLAQLVIGQEHRPPFFGHVMGFGLTGWLPSLAPVTIGYEAPPGSSLARTNTDVLREMRSRGAITSYVHAFSGEADPMQAGLGIGKAFPVDAALGLVDTLEWAAASRGSFVPWYAALNNGLRIAAIGGEDSITNLHISRLVGCVRTYVFLDRQPLTPTTWWQAAKAGRSFVTTGPLVELRAAGELPGGEVALPTAGPVDVNVRVRSITPLHRVQIVMNGQPIQDIPLDASRTRVDWQGRIVVERSAWLHLRAEGTPAERAPLDALYAQAFTNPIWITVDGRPVRDRAAAEYALQWIDRSQIMADAWPGWTSAAERTHVFGQFDEARAVYRRFAQEAEPAAATRQEGASR